MLPRRRSPSASFETPAGVARRDEDAGFERHHLREKADVLAQSADHVSGVRAHRELAVLLDADREVLRIVDLVARDDPWAQSGEGIEPFPDVARVLPAPPQGSRWLKFQQMV